MATETEVKYKWKFAIGTTSRVPGRTDLHYVIGDFDGIRALPLIVHSVMRDNLFKIQETPNGIHFYSNLALPFRCTLDCLKQLGCDPAWIRIGKNRGYWFLADKAPISFSWPVERMTLKWSDPYGEKG